MEDRHAIDVARAFAAVGGEAMHLLFRALGVAVELPHLLQLGHFAGWRVGSHGFKRVHHAVAPGEKNQRTPVDLSERRG